MSRFLLAAAAAAAIAAALAELKQQQLLSGIRGKRLQVCIDLSSTLTPHPSAEARHSTTPHVPAKKIQIALVFPDPWYFQIPGIPSSLIFQDPWYAQIPGFKIGLGQDSWKTTASVH